MRPEVLKAGDFLLYRNFGWVGNAVSWGSWRNVPREALEYSHIGLVFDAFQSYEMNPPCSRLFPLTEVPWDRVDVYRLDVKGIAVFDNQRVLDAFHASCRANVGKRYNYVGIAQMLGVGLLSRIGLSGLSRYILASDGSKDLHRTFCSQESEDRVTDAVRMLDPQFDLFPDLGHDRAEPADFPRSPWIVRVS